MISSESNDIFRLSALMCIAAVLWIALLLISAADIIPFSSSITGWIAVCGASFVFGSTGVPMKDPNLQGLDLVHDRAKVAVFAAFTCIGITIVNFPIFVYCLAIGRFVFSPWALLGSLDILIIGVWSFLAVQALGYAKAPAIWCSIGMITAFLFGAFAFDEEISNPVFGGLAIPCLIVGVATILLSNESESSEIAQRKASVQFVMQGFEQLPSADDDGKDSEFEEVYFPGPHNNNHYDVTSHDKFPPLEMEKNSLELSDKSSSSKQQQRTHLLWAILFCLLTGFCDGALNVPYKLSNSKDLLDTFSYLATFGIGACVLSVLLLSGLYVCSHDKQATRHLLRVCFAPGLASGVLWAAANFMSVHATEYLGLRIGFPLTQTCVVFAAMWGIFYFHEIDVKNTKAVIKLLVGVLLVICGSVFLAQSG